MTIRQAILIGILVCISTVPVILEIMHAKPWIWYMSALFLCILAFVVLHEPRFDVDDDRPARPTS